MFLQQDLGTVLHVENNHLCFYTNEIGISDTIVLFYTSTKLLLCLTTFLIPP